MHLVKIKKLAPHLELHVIDIQEVDYEFEKKIDDFLVSICEGESFSEIINVKKRLKDFLSTKTESTRMGAIAEFFIHLYMRINGYKQEFLFFNLEEGSIKKGFDGYFSKEDETYIVESKSGLMTTKNIKHEAKLKEAFSDIEKYVSGKSDKGSNNPWRNAYNHASHIDVGSSKAIRTQIKELSDLYDKNNFKKVEEFNIIPCSTIFLDGEWSGNFSDEILGDYKSLLNFKGKSIKAVCITKQSIHLLNKYLSN
ncbi:hypothetical protein [Deefgea rivuli]|uniref:hypothetical protein n=1 Tax=Deefgea rivuli TaxID=400948 RepID=UPI0004826737|nr:hypothetical protein [Deefgea rivuli]